MYIKDLYSKQHGGNRPLVRKKWEQTSMYRKVVVTDLCRQKTAVTDLYCLQGRGSRPLLGAAGGNRLLLCRWKVLIDFIEGKGGGSRLKLNEISYNYKKHKYYFVVTRCGSLVTTM